MSRMLVLTAIFFTKGVILICALQDVSFVDVFRCFTHDPTSVLVQGKLLIVTFKCVNAQFT